MYRGLKLKRVNGFLIFLGWAELWAVWAGLVMGAKNLEDRYHIWPKWPISINF